MAAAQVVLVIAFFVGAIFIWIEVFPDAGQKRSRAISIVLLAVLLGGLDWWTLKQKRAHVYVGDIAFFLGNTPPLPENFANITFRNDSDLDVSSQECWRIATRDVYFDDPIRQRQVENDLFESMLKKIPSDNCPTIKMPAHRDKSLYSAVIPLTLKEIETTPQAIYFMGRFSYTDENGSHHTDWCAYIKNKKEPIFDCKEHNEAP